MFLEYGVSTDGGLVWIGEVARGASALHCPYCDGLLTAKKGSVKGHHFAHTGATCRQTERDQDAIALPAYDNFNLHLPPRVLAALREYSAEALHYDRGLLERHELIEYNKWSGDYELTKKGKLVLGQLSLNLFCQFQAPLIVARHAELEEQATDAHRRPNIERQIATLQGEIDALKATGDIRFSNPQWHQYQKAQNEKYYAEAELRATGTIDLQTALSDLRLFRAQWRRVLACSLYFLEIDGGQLYKIGVTTRPIEQRIAEITGDLFPHIGSASTIRVLGIWSHRGNVELYFKYRYATAQKTIGDLTEYYKFDDVKPVLGDLRRMNKERDLTELEAQVLRGEPSATEARINAETIEQKRRSAIRKGMKRSAERGKTIGRPTGQETLAEFLAKPDSQAIAAALADGASIREAAKRTGVSTGTVQKVKTALIALTSDESGV